MRLTNKHIRQMILREMKELNEQAGWSREAAYIPPPEQQTSMRDQMVQEIMAITVPGIPGTIYSQVEAEAMADAKIAALNAPMAGAGMSTSYGAPRAGRVVKQEAALRREIRQIILKEMQMQVMPLPAPVPGEVPSDSIEDMAKRVMALGPRAVEKIKQMLDSAGEWWAEDTGEDSDYYRSLNRRAFEEGFEPGSYRAEGDRKLNEVSVGVGRWNLLAGTEK